MNERGLQARFIQRSGRSSTRPTRPITEMQSDTCMHDANLMLLQQCIQTAKGSAATPRQGVALPGLDSKSLTELLGAPQTIAQPPKYGEAENGREHVSDD